MRLVTALVLTVLVSLVSPDVHAASVEGFIPKAASSLGRSLDRQIADRVSAMQSGISLAFTVPADINDLETANPLARQMSEELARWFAHSGYTVLEIRKGADILFEPGTGELLLTRRTELLESRTVKSTAVVTGTYTVTPTSVRFNIRVVESSCREVLGVASVTIPVTGDVRALLGTPRQSGYLAMGIQPTVATTLP